MTQASILYSDGSGWTGVSSAICVCKVKKKKIEKKIKVFYEEYDSFVIELLALREAVNMANYGSIIYTDSKAIISYLKKIEKELNSLSNEISKKKITVEWIPRSKNIAGKALEKRLKRLHSYCNGKRRGVNLRW